MKADSPRLSDIAENLDLSVSTVSRALRGDRRISRETTARVVAEANKMGYIPKARETPGVYSDTGKALAGTTISGRPSVKTRLRRVRLLIPDVNVDPFFGGTIMAVMQGESAYHYDCDVVTLSQESNLVANLSATAKDGYDGAIVCTWEALTDTTAQALRSLAMPIVFVNRHVEGQTYAVTHDDFSAGVQAAQLLLGLGHRRIAHLAGRQDYSSFRERRIGFQMALQRADTYDPELFYETPQQTVIVDWTMETVQRLLALPHPPTAFWAYSDVVAGYVLMSLRMDGKAVPDDVSVIGFDDGPHAVDTDLTTFRFSSEQLGRQAVRLLDGIWRGEADGPMRVCVSPPLVQRATVGPLNSKD